MLVCLPHNALNRVEWCGEPLRHAMNQHIAYYNYPGHYLRISVLFRCPFWASIISDAWFMHDAFGGCCIYNESARHSAGGLGVLGWLLAGSDARTMSNLDDSTLIRRVLESLPGTLQGLAREHFIEAKIHRLGGSGKRTTGRGARSQSIRGARPRASLASRTVRGGRLPV